jgi:hypothetical protein
MAVAPPIPEPTVNIFQQVAKSSPEVPAISLSAVVVAPNYQVVRHLEDDGSLNSEALVGAYQNLDMTITYALPGVEKGSALEASSVRLWLRLGSQVTPLDSLGDEQVVISSSGEVAGGVLTDEIQDFAGSGVLSNQDIENNDYIYRGPGTDDLTRDFPILDVTATTLTLGNDPNGDVAPKEGEVDYEIVLNPTKFILNGDALFASLTVLSNEGGGSGVYFEDTEGGVRGNQKRVKYVLAPDPGDPLSLQLNGNDLTIILENDGGAEVSTDNEIVEAISNPAHPAYEAEIAAFINATVLGDGEGTPLVADLATFTPLSGGFESNSLTVDANLLPSAALTGQLYVSYRSLRRVFTAQASIQTTGNNPVVAVASTVEEIEALVGEISADNPLALMMWMVQRNAPGRPVYGLGLDAVSENEPDGTLLAWGRAADFLTGQPSYWCTPASQRNAVHDLWIAHINLMNGDGTANPEILSRFLFLNKTLPNATPDVLLGSGLEMSRTDSREASASENFTLLGVEPGDVLVLSGGTVSLGYDAILLNGTRGFEIVEVKTGDDFTLVTSSNLPSFSDSPWSIYRPGAPLQVGGVWDKQSLAETINQNNGAIRNRAISVVHPDNCTIELNGQDVVLPGYYACAGIMGLCVSQKTSVSKTRQSIGGIKAIRGANDFFSAPQLDLIQGGGTWTLTQPTPTGPVLTRMALSTDVSNVVNKNPTSTWQMAKYTRLVRTISSPLLAGSITTELLDDLATRLDMVGKYMKDQGELARRPRIDSIEQGDGVNAPVDRVIIKGNAAPRHPLNGIDFYLLVSPT